MKQNDTAIRFWEPVLTNPASRTPWQIGRRTAGNGLELTPVRYETWALANDDADALNAAVPA